MLGESLLVSALVRYLSAVEGHGVEVCYELRYVTMRRRRSVRISRQRSLAITASDGLRSHLAAADEIVTDGSRGVGQPQSRTKVR